MDAKRTNMNDVNNGGRSNEQHYSQDPRPYWRHGPVNLDADTLRAEVNAWMASAGSS